MRILAIDGDNEILKSFEWTLRAHYFNVYGTDDPEEAVDLGKLYDYDLIVLGDIDGDVLRSLRAAKVKTPILMVSNGDVANIVAALDAGADDYMVKPFHSDELAARCRAVSRRAKGFAESILTFQNLRLSINSQTVMVNDNPIHLTGKEYKMLELLMLRQGMTQSKEAFLNHLYGGMDEPELKIIDVFICKLRRKLAKAGCEDLIETVWGRGYMIQRDEQTCEPSIGPELALLRGGNFSHAGTPEGGMVPAARGAA